MVAVQPESAAARSGIREGDLIESIDGRVLGRGRFPFYAFTFNPKEKHVFLLVRDREKKQITLEPFE